mgnify:FL=1
MKLNVNIQGLDELKLKLAGLERKIKTAQISALNDAAQLGAKTVSNEIGKVFDRPTPFIRRSVVYFKAGAAGKKVRIPGAYDVYGKGLVAPLLSDRLEAVIDLSGELTKQGVSPSQVLAAQIFGGKRRQKRHEVALQRVNVLPNGYSVVPGEAAKIDSFGNMSSGQIRQILSFFSAAQMTSGSLGNMTSKRKSALAKGTKKTVGFEYFVVQPGQRRQFQRANGKSGAHSMQPGIYQRIFLGHGTAIKPVMIFVRSTNYKRRLDFYEIVQRAAQPEFARAFSQYTAQFLRERGL